MMNMGWKEGKGLGKSQSGTTECIQIKRRDDNVGLGKKNLNEPMNWKD
jgi:Pin2-interacting protein X1